MKCLLILFILCFVKELKAQLPPSDERAIYALLLQQKTPLPFADRTIARFYPGDIEAQVQETPVTIDSATGMVQMKILCAVPVQYEQTITQYLAEKGFHHQGALLAQLSSMQQEQLSGYDQSTLLSVFRLPLRNSWIGNVFNKEGTALSPILYHAESGLAFVKAQTFMKRRDHRSNPSLIHVLEKQGDAWVLTGAIAQQH